MRHVSSSSAGKRASASWLVPCASLLVSWSSAAAESCPCPKYDLPAIVREADVILTGKVLSATDDSPGAIQSSDGTWWGGTSFQTRVMVDVSTVLKGDAPRFVEVVTPTGPCGFVFAVGQTYLLVGKRQGPLLVTNVCQSNAKDTAIEQRTAAIRAVLDPAP